MDEQSKQLIADAEACIAAQLTSLREHGLPVFKIQVFQSKDKRKEPMVNIVLNEKEVDYV